MNCNIGDRDLRLKQIRQEIINKKRVLERNMLILKKDLGENVQLSNVLNDYKEYNRELSEKKRQQVLYFEMMNKYLDDIKRDNSLTEEAILRANNEQQYILEEMNKVKMELEELLER
jgi:hypothetical protein